VADLDVGNVFTKNLTQRFPKDIALRPTSCKYNASNVEVQVLLLDECFDVIEMFFEQLASLGHPDLMPFKNQYP